MDFIRFFIPIIVCLSCTSNGSRDRIDLDRVPRDSVQVASTESINDSSHDSGTVTIEHATLRDQANSKATESSFFSFQLNIVSLLLLGGAMLLGGVYIRRLKYNFNQRYERIEKQLKSNLNENFAVLQKGFKELKTQIDDLKQRKSIESDQYSPEQKTREVFLSIEKSIEPKQTTVPLEVSEKRLFMPAPNEDGSFDESFSSDVKKPIATLYEFRIYPDTPDKAEFSFCADENGMKKALSNPRENITPACYEENDAFGGMRRVVMKKPGLALKEGDKWIVTSENKAHIKYE